MERTQIYLSKRETEALDRVARETGHTRSHLIREAIREKYGAALDVEEKLRILRETFGAWKDREYTGAEYVERLRWGALDRKLEEWGRARDEDHRR